MIVSRNHQLDGEALASALRTSGAGYIGVIGSRRKIWQVFDRLRASGVSEEGLGQVYAPIGFDIGADAPGRDYGQRDCGNPRGLAGAKREKLTEFSAR